ncbi:PaaX domain-containing protein, C- domain protein [Mycolicibacterium sp. CH28]|uniref:PaaX family transcriptional regulator C-terminal domain-containing protein n=1 Tax=Mycolicibacterium sp. CH28 TaxID=2512237 RepID=UPI001081F5CB|nr:PaaX family transcriptional regulator C-terminal domain-containing protein [Mycolicibacterium sp. CH28]TGD85361.1 PaaX domain-containing protein, C- domain protein [Mycolicibacterium sp. CH28]
MPATLSKMTARSVVLSVLLGAHPAWATSAELLQLTADFGIREQTLRVALTRMVATGDLVRSDDGYRLSDRLTDRQRRQDGALNPRTRKWGGSWITVVIIAVGMDARARAAMRNTLQLSRFGELREGVWMRPDNLDDELPAEVSGRVRVLHARDDDPAELAQLLWGLDGWSHTGHRLLAEMASARDIPHRFVAAAGMVRHLLTDPVLPGELLPPNWPGAELRAAYQDFAAELGARRDDARLVEAT